MDNSTPQSKINGWKIYHSALFGWGATMGKRSVRAGSYNDLIAFTSVNTGDGEVHCNNCGERFRDSEWGWESYRECPRCGAYGAEQASLEEEG